MSEDTPICCGCERNERQLDYIEDGAWEWTYYGKGQLCPECAPRFQVHEEPKPPEPCPKCGGSGTVFEEWHALPGRCMQPCPECSGKVSLTNLIEGSWEGPPKSAAQAVNESRLDKAMREEASRRHQTPALPEAPRGCGWRANPDDTGPDEAIGIDLFMNGDRPFVSIWSDWDAATVRRHVEAHWPDKEAGPFPGWPSDQPTEEPHAKHMQRCFIREGDGWRHAGIENVSISDSCARGMYEHGYRYNGGGWSPPDSGWVLATSECPRWLAEQRERE